MTKLLVNAIQALKTREAAIAQRDAQDLQFLQTIRELENHVLVRDQQLQQRDSRITATW